MGLDISFYKVVKARQSKSETMTIEEAHRLNVSRAKARVRAAADRVVKKLSALSGEEYAAEYAKVFPTMAAKYTPYTWKYEDMTKEVKPIEDVKEWWQNFVRGYYAQDDAYFRKVNFIYRYFGNRLDDEEACFVTKADLTDLIDRCEKVLADHDKAAELLPTTSGFFFGSTDYDNWYFGDVKDALKQFKKLLKGFDEDTDIIYVVMSW